MKGFKRWIILALFLCVGLQALDAVVQQSKISVRFDDADLANVIRYLVEFQGQNAIVDPAIKERVSLNLREVTPKESLQALLRTYNLAMHQLNAKTVYIASPQKISSVAPPTFLQLKNVLVKDVRDKVKSLFPGVTIESDDNTNTLIFFGDKERAAALQQVLAAIDRPSAVVGEATQTEIVALKYSDAKKVQGIVQRLFIDVGAPGGAPTGGGPGGTVTAVTPRQPGTPPISGESPGTAPAVSPSSAPPAGAPTAPPGVALIRTPTLKIDVDESRNSLILQGTRTGIDRVKNFVASLDLPIPQVMIETKVIDVNTSALSELGVKWPTAFTGQTFNFAAMSTLPSTENLTATVNMLVQRSKARILANSQLTTLDRQQARIFIGDSIPIISEQAIVTGGAQQAQATITNVNVGVNLQIIPEVNEDGFVTLDIRPDVSNFVREVRSGNNVAVQTTTRNAQTKLRVKSGSTIFLGGLIRNEEREAFQKVPVLGDIPLLGKLFQNKRKQTDSSEVIFLITPHILF